MIEKICARLEEAFPVNPYPNEFTNGRNLGIKKAIEIVQEVAKDGGWIPVEVELPKNCNDVWVTVRTESGCYVTSSYYDLNLERWRIGKLAEVIAWQPKIIPLEPYEPKDAPYQKGEPHE